MKYWTAFFGYALLLGCAWAGACTSPPPPVESTGEVPMAPGVVVIGATRDGSATGLDGALPSGDGSPGTPATGEGRPSPTDGGIARAPADSSPGQRASEGGGPTAPETPDDAGGGTAMGNGPADTGTVPPVSADDAGAPRPPPTVIDASSPPVVDAGPPPAIDAGRVGCLPGLYKGKFKGEISALLGLVMIEVGGDITIEVDLVGAPADRLQIRNGLLQGTDTSDQRNPLFARISGVLNCSSKQLENGTITDGTYNRVDPIWGGPPTTTTFTGTVTATYSDNPPSADGTWQVQNATGTRTSIGTWNAALQ